MRLGNWAGASVPCYQVVLLIVLCLVGNMTVAKELNEINKGSVESLMALLKKYEGMLGPNNYHMVEVIQTYFFLLSKITKFSQFNYKKLFRQISLTFLNIIIYNCKRSA
jgi:hypothetical protein